MWGKEHPKLGEGTLKSMAVLTVKGECLIPLQLTLLSKGHSPKNL